MLTPTDKVSSLLAAIDLYSEFPLLFVQVALTFQGKNGEPHVETLSFDTFGDIEEAFASYDVDVVDVSIIPNDDIDQEMAKDILAGEFVAVCLVSTHFREQSTQPLCETIPQQNILLRRGRCKSL